MTTNGIPRAIPVGSVARRTWTHKGKRHSGYAYTLTVRSADGARQRYRKQFPTRAEAQEALDALREQLKNPKPPEPPAKPGLTLREALDRLVSEKTRKKASTRRGYDWIAKHLKAAFGAETLLARIMRER